jgi:hypothetical protein
MSGDEIQAWLAGYLRRMLLTDPAPSSPSSASSKSLDPGAQASAPPPKTDTPFV